MGTLILACFDSIRVLIVNDFAVCLIIAIFVINKRSGYDARGTYSEDSRHRMG